MVRVLVRWRSIRALWPKLMNHKVGDCQRIVLRKDVWRVDLQWGSHCATTLRTKWVLEPLLLKIPKWLVSGESDIDVKWIRWLQGGHTWTWQNMLETSHKGDLVKWNTKTHQWSSREFSLSNRIPFGRAWSLPKLNASHGWWLGKLASTRKCYKGKECYKLLSVLSAKNNDNHLFLHTPHLISK